MDGNYLEIAHTADLALRVWATDYLHLLITAAQGMYALMGVEIGEVCESLNEITVAHGALESILVDFLNELLYQLENGIVYKPVCGELDENGLRMQVVGHEIGQISRQIKAATFHGLNLQTGAGSLQVEIVFDV